VLDLERRGKGPESITRAVTTAKAIEAVAPALRRAARQAGLRDFRFHDLRHHGATMALNKGFTAPIVMALGGWKTERMMRRYAAVTDETLRLAAEAVSGAEPALFRSSATKSRQQVRPQPPR
jgi:integrase